MSNDKLREALELAQKFHEVYERLAPKFSYETRKETRQFDPTTPNGRLMVAVCGELLQPAVAQEQDALQRERQAFKDFLLEQHRLARDRHNHFYVALNEWVRRTERTNHE